MAIRAREAVGQFEQAAQKGGAIVVSEINQAGLGDEAAQFDQVMGAFAALHDPGPRVLARCGGFSPPRQC